MNVKKLLVDALPSLPEDMVSIVFTDATRSRSKELCFLLRIDMPTTNPDAYLVLTRLVAVVQQHGVLIDARVSTDSYTKDLPALQWQSVEIAFTKKKVI